jgi:hypothetical protein
MTIPLSARALLFNKGNGNTGVGSSALRGSFAAVRHGVDT